MDFTFLVTYYAAYNLLEICRDSLDKFYPDAKKIMSQQDEFDINDLGKWDKELRHNMQKEAWAHVCRNLIEACDTDIGVFIEHDVFLLKPIDDLIEMVRSGKYDLVGVDEDIPGLRKCPGSANQNFFILNIKKIKEMGINTVNITEEGIKRRKEKGYQDESAFGLSDALDKKYLLKAKYSGYAHGTVYGDYAHHLWWGSYPKRRVENDGVDRIWLENEVERLIQDYWNNNLKFK